MSKEKETKEPQPRIKSKSEKTENNINPEKKKKNNSKCLYTCESVIDSYEYKLMAKYFQKRFYKAFVIRGSFLNLFLSAIVAIISLSLVSTLIFMAIYQIFIMILYKVRFEHYCEQVYNANVKQGTFDTKIETEFYDDYLIRKGESITLTIKYSEISRCIENDTNFYLEYPKQNSVIIIQKSNCDLDLINFIRESFDNIENRIGDNTKIKGEKKYRHPKFISNAMLILFIITIISLLGALGTLNIVDTLIPPHGLSFTKNMWVLWCWLPIPILSIVLGFKFKLAGFNCTRNIVAGFIIGIFLLIYGSFCMFPTYLQDYSNINQYKDIIDAKLPNNGVLEILDGWTFYEDDNKTENVLIYAYYDREDVKELVESIETSENWVLSKNIKSDLKIFVTSLPFSDVDAYYSIYNKTTNQYNTLPDISGNYEIYAMKYDKSDKQLSIHKFKYAYNK